MVLVYSGFRCRHFSSQFRLSLAYWVYLLLKGSNEQKTTETAHAAEENRGSSKEQPVSCLLCAHY
eukprot:6187838-Pleurochrysis_carterae.AAC.1